MSGVGAFGLLWAVSGIFFGSRWWREREEGSPSAVGGLQRGSRRPRFGMPVADSSGRRLQAMRLAYAAGTLITGTGFLLDVGMLLALGAGLMNLGTIHLYLVVALDREPLDAPLLPRPPRIVLAKVLDRPLA